MEQVFSLERKGELDKFAPFRKKLKNRMLLWHGNRNSDKNLSNVKRSESHIVFISSQGY